MLVNSYFRYMNRQNNQNIPCEYNTWVSKKFCNILACASLWHVYPMTKIVQGVKSTSFG